MKTPSAGYRGLVELLYLMKDTTPDVEELYGAAIYAIKNLKNTLNQQSTKLAEALKLKNDALEEIRIRTNDHLNRCREIDQLKVSNRDLRELANAHEQALEKARSGYEILLALNDRHARELSAARTELDQLKSGKGGWVKLSEPLFRVDQVVSWGNSYHKIVKFQRNGITQSTWEYYLGPVLGWVFEKNLRALTDEEK